MHAKPPSAGRIDRLIRWAFHTFEERWYTAVFERPVPETRRALDDLLVTGGADDDNTEPRACRIVG
jgi:hypothetical protein